MKIEDFLNTKTQSHEVANATGKYRRRQISRSYYRHRQISRSKYRLRQISRSYYRLRQISRSYYRHNLYIEPILSLLKEIRELDLLYISSEKCIFYTSQIGSIKHCSPHVCSIFAHSLKIGFNQVGVFQNCVSKVSTC